MPDLPSRIRAARAQWSNTGSARPPFAEVPGPGQESVWDYPRPPAYVPDARLIEVRADDLLVAATSRSIRVLETASPPTFYLPPDDVVPGTLVPAPGRSMCEWKGEAEYLALASGGGPVAWRYPAPFPEFEPWAGWVGFYPGRIDCTVDGERVRPQPGGFYGGWITDDVVGPCKGDPGTEAW
jgi:uncharacterized protein (DUF427 family)